MFNSFRTTLVAIIVISASLPVILLSVLLFKLNYNIISESAYKELKSEAVRLADGVSRQTDLIISQLIHLSTNDDIVLATRKSPLGFTHFLGERAVAYFHETLSKSHLLSGLYLMDAQFNVVLSAPPNVENELPDNLEAEIKAAFTSWINAAHLRDSLFHSQNQEYIDQIWPSLPEKSYRTESLSHHLIVIFAPVVHTMTNEINGTICGVIPINNIMAMIARQQSPEHAQTDLLRNNQSLLNLLFSPTSEAKTNSAPPKRIACQVPLQIRNSMNTQRIEYQLELSELYHLRFAKSKKAIWDLSILIICSMLLLALVSYFIARKLTSPVNQLILLLNEYMSGFHAAQIFASRRASIPFSEFQRVLDVLEHMENRILKYIHELKEAEEKYRGLLTRLNDAVFRMSLPDGRFEYFSQAAEKVFGYPTTSFMNPAFDSMKVIHPEYSAFILSEWEKLSQGVVSPSFEYKVIDAEGNERWVYQSNTGIFDERGTLIAIEGCCSNITKRKQAEQELARTRIYLNNIIDSMPSILMGINMHGRIMLWNREAEKQTGISEKEAGNKPLLELMPNLGPHLDIIRQAISEKTVKKIEKLKKHTPAGAVISDIVVYPLDGNGWEEAVIRVDDITERVRIEEIMVQSEKMVSVGGLAAGMAHEINNPLAGMLQSAQVIQMRLSDEHVKNLTAAEKCGTTMDALRCYMEQRNIYRMIHAILDSGKRAAQIVENMLSFSRVSTARFFAVDLRQLLDKTIELAANDYDLKKKYDFRNIEIIRWYDDAMPLVHCEASKIQQVLLNILSNGAHAMAEYRRSQPGKNRFILRIQQHETMARIEIEDNGPGMTEAVRKRVFEPFFTTKEVGVGTGLGLSVSYFIITENHGGKMYVESTPGKGSRFIMLLPITRL